MKIGVSLLLLLTLVVAVCGKKSSGPIYHKTDDVVILDAENFRTKVINSTSSWFIMFYSQWCGHCKEFAPIYKKLATDMKEWKFLKLGVVDCSAKSEKNKRDNGMGLCFKRPYFIGGMPDCRFFPAHSDKDSKGERRKFLGKKVYGSDGKLKEDSDSFEHVQKSIVNFLQDHHFKENSLNMEFLKRKDIESLADGHGKENLVLIIEPRSSIVGQLITLDLADSNVTVGRISSRNRKAVTSLHERFSVEIQEQQMCAVIITAERKPKVIYGSHQEDGELRKMVARYVMMEPTVLTSEGEGTDKEPIGDDVNTNSDEEEKVFMADLEIALTYSLRKEVAGKEVIEKDDLLNLKNYINVIVEFFPGRKQTMKFLRKIRKLATSRSSIDWESWQQILLRAKNTVGAFLSTNEDSELQFPSCFWQLMHTVMTQYYRTAPDMDPLLVLRAMNGYMNSFFTCETCKRNWQEESEDMEDFVDSSSSALLYLWRKHNSVNRRLNKESWPSKELCPQCWSSEKDTALEAVEAFIARFYHFENISQRGVRDEDDEDDDDDVEEEKQKKAAPKDEL